ncbi:MAG: N-acetylglucosamine-6-phosphate deacetylase [Candidatus Brockarchaeota archaeon]|nr:N-acetylglucosamine-6-phosphate deacetylase [Candidatus Brockarchaeota archaeon]MBO3767708.1 N-acetylglucosamine-6-phosphate deacetylase [Candidatus Brockarchaeota archaeon]MBO3801176.1 N-acetylglucosamine-6-phosphate deacetylase [Candidatus Brockarchaeota archaeon]
MKTSKILIKNARIINPTGETYGSILISNGKIKKIMKEANNEEANQVIDASGKLVFPGFIDVHIQGANGYDILDEDKNAVKEISKKIVEFGVTGFLATTVYKPKQENKHIELSLKGVSEGLEGARFLGFHLEGPFISREKKGMIQESSICEPSEEVLLEVLKKCNGNLRMMTIAPELKGAHKLIEILNKNNVIPSFGHSAANYEETQEAIRLGLKHVTHLFNAMNPIHHRSPGPVIAILESKEVTAQLIVDGMHIHPSVVKFVSKILGEDRILLITDGVRSLGLPDGKYFYDGLTYISKDGTARYTDGTLVGTSVGISELARRFIIFSDFPLRTVAKVASYNAAKLLTLEKRKGSVEEGKDADIAILDNSFKVYATLVEGKIVFLKT